MHNPTAAGRRWQAEQRREQLLDAALALFAERGMAGTTVKDLAAATGTAEGLIYHYVRSKEELLVAVVERRSFLPALREALTIAPDRPASEVLPALAQDFHAVLEDNAQLVRIFLHEAQANPVVAAQLGSMIAEAVDLLCGYLERRVAVGELRPHDTAVTARSLLYTVVMLHITRVAVDAFIPALVDNQLRGIGR